jgi:hypothetical protein
MYNKIIIEAIQRDSTLKKMLTLNLRCIIIFSRATLFISECIRVISIFSSDGVFDVESLEEVASLLDSVRI